ncbi:MAG: hypothetical protein LBT00_02195 [Spirochaetaceae bacterium]|nr:hypothetical protein [Spirochaetaceae bacterium]
MEIGTGKEEARGEIAVIARSEATKQSRRGKVSTLDCFTTLAMTGGPFVMTGGPLVVRRQRDKR